MKKGTWPKKKDMLKVTVNVTPEFAEELKKCVHLKHIMEGLSPIDPMNILGFYVAKALYKKKSSISLRTYKESGNPNG